MGPPHFLNLSMTILERECQGHARRWREVPALPADEIRVLSFGRSANAFSVVLMTLSTIR